MGQRITDKFVRELEPPERGKRIYYDDKLIGFGVRITPGGAKTFVYRYRVRGKGTERTHRIGRYVDERGVGMTVLEARNNADKVRIKVDLGKDPQGELNEKRDAVRVPAFQ